MLAQAFGLQLVGERGGEGRGREGLLLRYYMPSIENIMVPLKGAAPHCSLVLKWNNNAVSQSTGKLFIGESATVFLITMTRTEQVMDIKLTGTI